MNTCLLIITSLLAVLIVLLSEQIPRYFQHRKTPKQRIAPNDTDSPTTVTPNQRRWNSSRNEARTRPMTDGTDTPTRGSENDEVAASTRRPWDPPFPQRPAAKSDWLVLPPSAPRLTEEESEDVREEAHANVKEDSVVEEKRATLPPAKKPKEKKGNKSAMSILWLVLAVLLVILLVFAFAILIAHCLAWFIVYKTETRLGEARRGLVQGGEMRLCLCARG
jgi:uncharacterized integral membrane protein